MTGFLQRLLTRGAGPSFLPPGQVPFRPRPQSRFEPGNVMDPPSVFMEQGSEGTRESGVEGLRAERFGDPSFEKEISGSNMASRFPADSGIQADAGHVPETRAHQGTSSSDSAPPFSEPPRSRKSAHVQPGMKHSESLDGIPPQRAFPETRPPALAQHETWEDQSGPSTAKERPGKKPGQLVFESAQDPGAGSWNTAFQDKAFLQNQDGPSTLPERVGRFEESKQPVHLQERVLPVDFQGSRTPARQTERRPASFTTENIPPLPEAKTDPREVRPEMTVSIGQIQVEFVQPPTQPGPATKPEIQRTRGFDEYARARRGVRRR